MIKINPDIEVSPEIWAMTLQEFSDYIAEHDFSIKTVNGDIYISPGCTHKTLSRQAGHWYCECGAILTDKEAYGIDEIGELMQ